MSNPNLPTAPPPPPLVAATSQPDHHRPEAPQSLVHAARTFVTDPRTRWTWASTFADFAPHWYALRREADRGGYDALRQLIREYHFVRTWRGRSFRGVTLAGVTLWLMPDDPGTSNGGTVLINAKPADPSDWPQVLSLFE